jgi:prepilin peptidase CpaA
MTTSIFPLIFPALMVFAASYDCLALTISNRLCLIVAASFFPLAVIAGLSAGQILLHIACGLAMLGFGFALFARRWIGGGDAKLFAAAALWLGWSNIVSFAAIVSIAGGVLALAVIALRASWRRLPPFAARCWIGPKAELPYGVALAAGALLTYPQSFWMTGLPG